MAEVKSRRSSEIEWIILFGLSGFISPYCLHVYDDAASGIHESKYLYLGAFMLLLWLFSAAKLGLFNVFKLVRKTPKFFINGYKYLRDDYDNWRYKNGR